jgi:hypothetical protein
MPFIAFFFTLFFQLSFVITNDLNKIGYFKTKSENGFD